jgi:hypothetical protein
VDYDDIVRTIKESDTRINSVMLVEPEYELKYITFNDKSGNYNNAKNMFAYGDDDECLALKLLAKMILGGNV